MYHSVTFYTDNDTKNTWEDWRLIPSSPPSVGPFPIRKKFVDLPGGNGSLDLTDYLGNSVKMGVAEGSWSFMMIDQNIPREQQVREIEEFIHGTRCKAILEDDPFVYYTGRFVINNIKIGKNYSEITISYTIDPKRHPIEGES